MYSLQTPLSHVHGVGPKLMEQLSLAGITTIQDLLLTLPLHYRDYSQFCQIAALQPGETVTIQAEVLQVKPVYRSRRPMVTATVADESGKLTLYWFNNKFVAQSLKVGELYCFSGKVSDRKTITQPQYEKVTSEESIHTNRLVPHYTTQLGLAQGILRRIFKKILDDLVIDDDALTKIISPDFPDRLETFKQLHFPETSDAVITARERLALEELLGLIAYSQQIKHMWETTHISIPIPRSEPLIPSSIPFSLTAAQERVVGEIISDLQKPSPMNRLLQGDVGSGKTVVAGVAALQTLRTGLSVALVAPTKILAQQHFQTLTTLFPDIEVALVVSGSKANPPTNKPMLWVGTHALINKLQEIKPGLVIYDEQHRFGVAQRSEVQSLEHRPHLLTMTATPIPRTLLLTLFSHLTASVIDELPKNRIPTKTWVVHEDKRTGMYDWICKQIENSDHNFQALIVCPFIDPSEKESFDKVASATEKFAEVKKVFGKKIRVALLHGRQSSAEKDAVIEKLFSGEIDVLVTTPIVEVGIDLPQASAMVIESAERYGMASLHQLRGRVGRAGQQGYCVLFTSDSKTPKRLTRFAATLNGQKLAELDLENRGAGELFGTQQHGFNQLKYGSWANLELISKAQAVFSRIPQDWTPLIPPPEVTEKNPLAN